MSEKDENVVQFEKIKKFAIINIILISVYAAVTGIRMGIGGFPGNQIALGVSQSAVGPIILAVNLLILCNIGIQNPAKGDERNSTIMRFIFGIASIGFAAGIVGTKSGRIGPVINSIINALSSAPSALGITYTILRFVQLGLIAGIIVLCIFCIIAGVELIKLNKISEAGSSSAAGPRKKPTSDSVVVQQVVTGLYCPECGAKAPQGANFCEHCGSKIK